MKDLPYLNPRKVARGKYGNIFDGEGDFMDNVTEFEAKVGFKKEEIKRANAKLSGHRNVGGEGTGKMKIYFTNAEFIQEISENPDHSLTFIGRLQDPDPETAQANKQVVLKGVNFDEVPLLEFDVESPIEYELDFTFDDYDWL